MAERLFQTVIAAGLVGATLINAGCVKRMLLVRSQPEGALVTIDKRPVGHTPVAVPFTYYGTREVQLEKDGYQTVRVEKRLWPPWYEFPPLDFVSENFWPREQRDTRILDFQLPPLAAVNENQLIGRANQLRGNVQRGTVPMPIAVRQGTSSDQVLGGSATTILPVVPVTAQ